MLSFIAKKRTFSQKMAVFFWYLSKFLQRPCRGYEVVIVDDCVFLSLKSEPYWEAENRGNLKKIHLFYGIAFIFLLEVKSLVCGKKSC